MMQSFFQAKPSPPLAERLRPQSIDAVIGQTHLLGEGCPLRVAFDLGKVPSMILWGPPGIGKTTLARLIAQKMDVDFIALSAVLSGVKEIRDAIQQAEMSLQNHHRHTVLFVDEVHRFNKSQQDAFLPFVENGLMTFIGATTENPSFEVNNALLSRAQVFTLNALSLADLNLLFMRAQEMMDCRVPWTENAKNSVLLYADGDARRLLNILEIIFNKAGSLLSKEIDEDFLGKTLANKIRRFDKGGDDFYDQISALHKSVRGSNPDAALYWLQRMLDGGADPRYLARRIIRMAIEDIGLADPRAWEICLNASETYERLGTPEGELALAYAVVYLSVSAKSNAIYQAYNHVKAFVKQDDSRAVPLHLRNAPTNLMKELDYGKNYRYAHDEPNAYAAGENYFPDGLKPIKFYMPTTRGLEEKIKEKLERLAQLDEQKGKNNA